jgi:NAD(P)H-dependent FMN reductase
VSTAVIGQCGNFEGGVAHTCRSTNVPGAIVDSMSMRDFDTPSYDADVEQADGFPPGADRFRECVQTNDAFVISSPEYNASLPGY